MYKWSWCDMYGIVTGISDTDSIKYCPVCGEEVSTFHADGTATCNECGSSNLRGMRLK